MRPLLILCGLVLAAMFFVPDAAEAHGWRQQRSRSCDIERLSFDRRFDADINAAIRRERQLAQLDHIAIDRERERLRLREQLRFRNDIHRLQSNDLLRLRQQQNHHHRRPGISLRIGR